MVRFLIARPISVFAFFIALVLLGTVALFKIPVTLLPEIEIPNIKVQVNVPDVSAREIENSIVSNLRNSLKQTPYLKDIYSNTSNGYANLELQFDYGTNMDLAFLNVNEKIDQALGTIPKRIERPKVIKGSIADLPMLYLNVFYKDQKKQEQDSDLLELSKLTKNVLRSRLEGLPNVSLIDLTGSSKEVINISLKPRKLKSLNLKPEQIVELIENNDIDVGNIAIQDGYYEYNVKIPSGLKSIAEFEEISFKVGNQIIPLRTIATIERQVEKRRGKFLFNGVDAINIGIVKRQNSSLEDYRKDINSELALIQEAYPYLGFSITQDQTTLVNTTISNLRQSIFFGIICASLVVFLFIRKAIPSFIVFIIIPISLLASIQLFYLFNIPISIVSLAGLILSVGLMIDNSIIIIENIYQYIGPDQNIAEACVVGTNELITPLISSTLTTCGVFLPLVFLSGVSGALLKDQALSIFICLGASLAISIVLLPVLFYFFTKSNHGTGFNQESGFLMRQYQRILNFHLKHRYLTLVMGVVPLILSFYLLNHLDFQSFPKISRDNLEFKVAWNENIDMLTSETRLVQTLVHFSDEVKASNVYLGEQQFIFSNEYKLGQNEIVANFTIDSPDNIDSLKTALQDFFYRQYPRATFTLRENKSIFDIIFPFSASKAQIGIQDVASNQGLAPQKVRGILDHAQQVFGQPPFSDPEKEVYIEMELDHKALTKYDFELQGFLDELQYNLNAKPISKLKSAQELVPIYLSYASISADQNIYNQTIKNKEGIAIPLKDVSNFTKEESYEAITAGQTGEYTKLTVDKNNKAQVIKWLNKHYGQEALIFPIPEQIDLNKLLKELVFALLVSILLLYFIVAIQFESFLQPLIILLEIPIDLFGALALLYLFGQTLNIMSLTGIIIMTGIIINDSILKIDKINQLKKSGYPLISAIHKGGEKRLRPILMTTITTIVALVPIFWTTGLGAELQSPMSLSLIGGLFLGTYISLFYLPVILSFGKKHNDIV